MNHQQHQHQHLPTPSIMTDSAFEVNPSPRELAVGWLEQWRRSKLSKAWKRVLVSLVKSANKGETSLCIWREVLTDSTGSTGSSSLELLQQIPLREVEFVDFDSNIHSLAGHDGSSNGERNRFALTLFQASEDVIFRSLQDPHAVSHWVTTLKTAQQFALGRGHGQHNGEEFEVASSSNDNTHKQPASDPPVDLLSFDFNAPTIPVNNYGHGHPTNNNMDYAQPQPHVQPQWQQHPPQQPQQPNFHSYPNHQQHQTVPPPMHSRSISPTPPQYANQNLNHVHAHQQQQRSHSPPPLSYHSNPYAPQPKMNVKKQSYPQQSQPKQQNQQQNRWNPTAFKANATQPQAQPFMMNHNAGTRNGHANLQAQANVQANTYPTATANANAYNHHYTNHHPNHQNRSHTPPPRAKPPAPIPRPTATTNSSHRTQSQPNNSTTANKQQPPSQAQPPQAHRPARSMSAPLPKTHGNNHAEIKRQVIQDWALQPPHYQQLKPLADLVRTIPKVFPPHSTYVTAHAYFNKWDSGYMFELNANTEKVVRKLRFFLHPDKLPKDFDDDQTYLCKVLWDVVNDAQQQQQQGK